MGATHQFECPPQRQPQATTPSCLCPWQMASRSAAQRTAAAAGHGTHQRAAGIQIRKSAYPRRPTTRPASRRARRQATKAMRMTAQATFAQGTTRECMGGQATPWAWPAMLSAVPLARPQRARRVMRRPASLASGPMVCLVRRATLQPTATRPPSTHRRPIRLPASQIQGTCPRAPERWPRSWAVCPSSTRSWDYAIHPSTHQYRPPRAQTEAGLRQ